MTTKRVPSKIVIAGSSKITLNDRFSAIPKPRVKATVMKAQPKRFSAQPKRFSVEYEEVEYVPKFMKPRPKPRQFIQQRAVIPIQNRVSFVNAMPVQRFYPRINNFVHRSHQMQNNFKKPFRQNFNHQNRKMFPGNNNRFQHPKQKQFPTMPAKKSVAELDRELDDYMRKPKHAPITI
ncbi:Chromatin target of PRMT1 protein C-terminal domain-containing protein [Caenorhabditis elegans]|uniref:Chromatin target of PRMT1 protein C-terminal domain-containing protein n=1 Tax=Caenorhabditis elegans TaxID=6239 RepID=Q9BPN9_CAEEL|nr:Chromatin target of PRMT1 protein C-terminal domain-containing protein [Caenorhabditis elegans]CCD70783.1 Chromatin target of PRMT1 protein C-terminal domain-containing protein [Caenorhabditis elegans]|eukprot:NP_490851.1 Uncharacterized protein CELE_Y92H12BR.2 [Caenorhabditis elegans]